MKQSTYNVYIVLSIVVLWLLGMCNWVLPLFRDMSQEWYMACHIGWYIWLLNLPVLIYQGLQPSDEGKELDNQNFEELEYRDPLDSTYDSELETELHNS